MPGFGSDRLANESRQNAIGLFWEEDANSFIDRPAGAALLDGQSGPIEPNMPDLRLTRLGPVIDFSINHKAAADAAAEGDIKHRIMIRSGAAQRFSQRGNVRIVIDRYGSAQQLPGPIAQREIGPALDLMRATGHASSPVDRATETNDGAEWMEFPQKFLKPMLYLIEDARRARILSDRESVSLKEFALFVAGNDLDVSS